jgi:hypothetical protein
MSWLKERRVRIELLLTNLAFQKSCSLQQMATPGGMLRARMFDGKVDMWPVARQIPALRSSRNRPAGTLEWKLHLLTKEVYTTLVCKKVGACNPRKLASC